MKRAKPVLLVVLKYKNLKLRKEKKKRRTVVYGRVYIALYGSRVAYGPSVTQVPTVRKGSFGSQPRQLQTVT